MTDKEKQRRENKGGFVMHHVWRDMLRSLDPVDGMCLIDALFDYDRTGEVPEFGSGNLRLAFNAVKLQLDKDMESYLKRCERNSENRKAGWNKNKESPDK